MKSSRTLLSDMHYAGLKRSYRKKQNQTNRGHPRSMTETGLTLLLFIGLGFSLHAQNGALAWAKRAGGNNIDEGIAVAVDADGYVFTTGYRAPSTPKGLLS